MALSSLAGLRWVKGGGCSRAVQGGGGNERITHLWSCDRWPGLRFIIRASKSESDGLLEDNDPAEVDPAAWGNWASGLGEGVGAAGGGAVNLGRRSSLASKSAIPEPKG